MDDPTLGEHSVFMFFPNDTYECIGRGLSPEAAINLAHNYMSRPAAIAGFISRIIVTDAGDCTNFEWKFRDGITFPDSPTIREWNTQYRARFNSTPETIQ